MNCNVYKNGNVCSISAIDKVELEHGGHAVFRDVLVLDTDVLIYPVDLLLGYVVINSIIKDKQLTIAVINCSNEKIVLKGTFAEFKIPETSNIKKDWGWQGQTTTILNPFKKHRGRKKGSKNKPK